MVSLRQRSSQISYAALPEGLDNLSDDSDHAGPSNPQLQALQSRRDRPSSAQSDDGIDPAGSDTSMSSGSDAYAPETHGGKKGRKLGKRPSHAKGGIGGGTAGKGKAEEAMSDSGSDVFVPPDEASSGDADDDDGVLPQDGMDLDMNAIDPTLEDPDDVLQTIDGMPKRGFSYPKHKYHKVQAVQVDAANAATEDRAGLVNIPPAYRAAMESMADAMIKSNGQGAGPALKTEEEAQDKALPAIERRSAKAHSKATRPVLCFLPRGNPLPWSSLLLDPAAVAKSTGKGKGKGKVKETAVEPSSEKVVYRIGESKMHRKWRVGRLAISAALGTPRSGWEGDGWFPEMYDTSQAPADQDMGDEDADDDVDIDPRTGGMARPIKRRGRPAGMTAEKLAEREMAAYSPLRRGGTPGTPGGGMDVDGEGEGGDEDEGVGRGTLEDRPPAGWTLRCDVRLGLDDVGRVRLMDVEMLSASEAEAYLPTVIDINGNPSHTIHLGPYGQQELVQLSMFDSFRTEKYSNTDTGWTLHPGGPIWGMDWCPLPPSQLEFLDNKRYLAISTLPHIDTAPALGEKWPRDTHGSIQIWSIPPMTPSAPGTGATADHAEGAVTLEARARCEMVLCVHGGPVMACKWMPMGAWDDIRGSKKDQRLPKMGILAALQLDGAVSFYAVPHPSALHEAASHADGPIYVNADTSLLRVELPDASPTCIEWLTGGKLAVGYTDGHIAAWNVLPALKDPSHVLLPDFYVQAADASITALTVGRVPPKDGQNRFIYNADPLYLACTSFDLTTRVMDLREPHLPVEIGRTRSLAVAFNNHSLTPMHADIDYMINMHKIKEEGPAKSASLVVHRGPVWDIGTSDFHTMVVSASADGSAILSSARMGSNRIRNPPARHHYMLYQRLFEMDYNQHTGHYRLLDGAAPERQNNEQAQSRRVNVSLDRADVSVIKTAAWSPRVAVHRVAWNNGCGIQNAGMLAIGTAMGLVRVQDVRPEWGRGNEAFVQQYPT